jgi:hypothetical protein
MNAEMRNIWRLSRGAPVVARLVFAPGGDGAFVL